MVSARRDSVLVDLAIESLRRSGRLRFRAQGTSMLPTIRPGSQVEIGHASSDQISAGDIVLTKTRSGLRLHRVVEIGAGSLVVTRGDNHLHNDEPCRAQDILGRLRLVGPAPRLWRRLLRRFR